MKRKSGSQKCTESKRKDLRISASAPGQRKISDVFQRASAVNASGSNVQPTTNAENTTGSTIIMSEEKIVMVAQK